MAPQHPDWKDKKSFASILKGDVKSALGGGEHAVGEMIAVTHNGMTTEEFQDVVKNWLATSKHPRFKLPYNEVVYQPMIELMKYLRETDSKLLLFLAEEWNSCARLQSKTYGIPPEQIIGSRGKLKFELREGKPVLLKLPDVDFVDDKEGKPVGIQQMIGRRPIAAFGNSDGDLQMLQWKSAGPGLRFCLYVHHTDAEREWAYDHPSSIGQLEKGLDEAKAKGWTVVSMKDDWKQIFAFESH